MRLRAARSSPEMQQRKRQSFCRKTAVTTSIYDVSQMGQAAACCTGTQLSQKGFEERGHITAVGVEYLCIDYLTWGTTPSTLKYKRLVATGMKQEAKILTGGKEEESFFIKILPLLSIRERENMQMNVKSQIWTRKKMASGRNLELVLTYFSYISFKQKLVGVIKEINWEHTKHDVWKSRMKNLKTSRREKAEIPGQISKKCLKYKKEIGQWKATENI